MRDDYGLGIGPFDEQNYIFACLLVSAGAMLWSVPLGDWDLELGS